MAWSRQRRHHQPKKKYKWVYRRIFRPRATSTSQMTCLASISKWTSLKKISLTNRRANPTSNLWAHRTRFHNWRAKSRHMRIYLLSCWLCTVVNDSNGTIMIINSASLMLTPWCMKCHCQRLVPTYSYILLLSWVGEYARRSLPMS